ncbi:MAG: hypothetical protein V1663_01690 [archaeon]
MKTNDKKRRYVKNIKTILIGEILTTVRIIKSYRKNGNCINVLKIEDVYYKKGAKQQ